jgi:hypothetical protein
VIAPEMDTLTPPPPPPPPRVAPDPVPSESPPPPPSPPPPTIEPPTIETPRVLLKVRNSSAVGKPNHRVNDVTNQICCTGPRNSSTRSVGGSSRTVRIRYERVCVGY